MMMMMMLVVVVAIVVVMSVNVNVTHCEIGRRWDIDDNHNDDMDGVSS
jgi:hypothetical protein